MNLNQNKTKIEPQKSIKQICTKHKEKKWLRNKIK